MRKIKYSQALSEATVQSMERDPNIFMTGIAVDYPSGIFGSTTEATKRFGPKRVFDAPAMENLATALHGVEPHLDSQPEQSGDLALQKGLRRLRKRGEQIRDEGPF